MRCSLSETERRERLAWIRREILPHVIGSARRGDGLAVELSDAPGLAEKLDRWIALERACCEGLSIERGPGAGPARLGLEIRGAAPQALLRALAGGDASCGGPDPVCSGPC